jgi:putative phosphoesterase
MRIFITSDLHLEIDSQGDGSTKKLASFVCQQGTRDDVLLILGDLGNIDEHFLRCLAHFRNFTGKKLLVLGNHDIWVMPQEERTSRDRKRQLEDRSHDYGFIPIEDNPQVIDEVSFIGNMGWYDYSFQDQLDIPNDAYEKKMYPGTKMPMWNDALYVDWGKNDSAVVDGIIATLERQLRQAGTKKIIVGLHHVPTKQLLFHPRWAVPRHIRFANAFLGSQKLADLFAKFNDKISHVFCGHIHMSKAVNQNGIVYLSVGSDYQKKQLVMLSNDSLTQVTF